MESNVYEGHRDLCPNILISENENNAYPRHFHRNIELLYVRSGMMTALINDVGYQCGADEIVFVPSYYAHEFYTPVRSNVLVMVIPHAMIADFHDYFSRSQPDFLLKDAAFNRNIREILELFLKNKNNANQYVLKGFLSVILGLIVNHYPETPGRDNRHMDLIVEILQYIEQNYQNDLTLEAIAEHFSYNKYYISRIFNRYVQKNFRYYLNSIRVQQLVSLYSTRPQANVSDLAMACGFDNMATFYRAFREVYGLSPRTFFNTLAPNSIQYNVMPAAHMKDPAK